MKWEKQLIHWISQDQEIMDALRLVKTLRLNEGAIAAGFIRNYVWDRLHECRTRTPLNDVDVIYYDARSMEEERDRSFERELIKQMPQYEWSVKNQARMHIRNHHTPYHSISDAMLRWPETATAVAVRVTEQDRIEVIAPHGLDDLFEMKVRRGPYFESVDYFLHRIESKNWRYLWPQLEVITHASEEDIESKTIHIRQLLKTDVDAFTELRLEGLRLYPEYFGESLAEAMRNPMEKMRSKIVSTKDRFVLGAWTEAQELVGVIGFYRESGVKFRHKGVLWGMYVTPSEQGQGIGRTLLQQAIARARTLAGLELLTLTIVRSNQTARRLYEEVGFRMYGREERAMRWNDQYWDEDYMCLPLEDR
ncbi:nucleotidyltransferase family protein [Paenibacillus guangzhouensis]|uniref:nucleotidyltransferase family protein n=1 Tax=Paenibacillus guangzhouensis TaxID=1473112 RepID=UPI001266AF95|nr:nucleotidyltransferase family protein [Paenibacillus guangzhouensis]